MIPDLKKTASVRLWSPKAGRRCQRSLCLYRAQKHAVVSPRLPGLRPRTRPVLCCPPARREPPGAPRAGSSSGEGRARPPETHPQSDVPSRRAREPRALPSHASVSPQNGKAASGGAGLSPAFSRNVRHEQACFLRPARPFLGVWGSRVLLNHSPQRVNAASLTRCVCELFKTLMLSFIIICNSCPG